mmetsp:Transcript_76741/g.220350  ORF Transcript_76741/g.220350 Transcript_76741/m.220350 type:complete len:633 (+) Transcript_76741:82-1980(+)
MPPSMEGFLFKKGQGTGFLNTGIGGRRNWLQRWFVLENEFLSYYETFDQTLNNGNGAPVNKKGMVAIHNCELNKFPSSKSERKYCFVIEHPERRPVYLCAQNENMMFLWLEALKKASKLEFNTDAFKMDLDSYYEILNFDPEKIKGGESPSIKDIQKAYRKACLKCHPDKFPHDKFPEKAEMFDQVQEAFEILLSCKEQEEEDKMYTVTEYAVTIKKGPRGVGLGLVVAQDPKSGSIAVTKVTDGIKIIIAPGEAKPHIFLQDVLVGIGDDRIVGWPIARVIDRLSDFRVPVGGTVKLTFSHKAKTDGSDDIDPDEPETPTEPTYAPMPPPGEPPMSAPSEQGSVYVAPPDGTAAEDAPAISDSPYGDEPSSATFEREASMDYDIRARSNTANPGLAGDFSSKDKTIQDLTEKLKESEAQCTKLDQENDELNLQVGDLADRLTMADARCSSMGRQLQDVEAAHAESEARAYQVQVEFQRVLLNSEEYFKNQKLASAGTQINVETVFKARAEDAPAMQDAQRKAVAAAVAVDPTGKMLQRWSLQGEGAAAKLMRLEERLANIGIKKEPSEPAPVPTKVDAGIKKSKSFRQVGKLTGGMADRKGLLKQRLEYRPKREFLVNSNILRHNDLKHKF